MRLTEHNYTSHDISDILAASNTNVLELAFEGVNGLIDFIKWCIENAPRGKRIKALQEKDKLILQAMAQMAELNEKAHAEILRRLERVEGKVSTD